MKQVSGTGGWGLKLSPRVAQLGGTLKEVIPTHGCQRETCTHESHDPPAPSYDWVPPPGARLYLVGHGLVGRDIHIAFYFLVFPDGRTLWLKHIDVFGVRHAQLSVVDEEDEVPDWMRDEVARVLSSARSMRA